MSDVINFHPDLATQRWTLTPRRFRNIVLLDVINALAKNGLHIRLRRFIM